jgi:hypothetical protein
VSPKWKELYRFPPTGRPVVLVLESPTGFMIKIPMVTNTDHVMVTKEHEGLGKHLTDETVKAGKGRNQPLGKVTSATLPTALLESLSVELGDDEPIYVVNEGPASAVHPVDKKDVPGADLVPDADLLMKLARVDLDSIPLLRKTTWGEAKRSNLPHGLRMERNDLVLYMMRLNGKVVRFPLIAGIEKLPVVADVSGIGALFDRARERLPERSGKKEEPTGPG